MIVIDTSGSTSQPTGVDVDEDGVVGEPVAGAVPGAAEPVSSDPDDSILAAEVAAAGRLLAGLDPKRTRAGLVTFAGEPVAGLPGVVTRVRRAALTEEPLTSDAKRLRFALGRVLSRGAWGGTYMAAGVDQATLELLGLEGSLSRADPASQKVILFFTDGEPTLPHPGSEGVNVRSVLAAARRARDAGVRIHSFAIGPEALAGPVSTVEMAAITDGLFTPVRHPGRLVRTVDGVSLARVQEVRIVNAAAGRTHGARVHADGSWDALVPLVPGENRLEVVARARDGSEATQTLTLEHRPGAAGPALPVELVDRRGDLLEERLDEIARERAERQRRELVIEIERERAAAVERAERQRKELEIQVERPAP